MRQKSRGNIVLALNKLTAQSPTKKTDMRTKELVTAERKVSV